MKKLLLNVLLLFSLINSSCNKNDNKETFTIQGQLIDGTNPSNKFANRKLTFIDYFDHRNEKTLGETITDSNGNFILSYESSPYHQHNVSLMLIDTNILAKNKLNSFEVGVNWNKKFHIGDSAIFDLYINKPLDLNDTLFISNWDSIYTIYGPTNSGLIGRFKCINYTHQGIIAYGVGKNNFLPLNHTFANFSPRGEPFVDEIRLSIK